MKIMKRKLKMMALSAVLAAGMLIPTKAMAQFNRNDGFFQSGGPGNRTYTYSGDVINEGFGGDSNHEITNDTFGVPLGSGLLVMAAAGAGYAVLKRKRVKSGV